MWKCRYMWKVAKCEKISTLNVKIYAICEKITLNVKKWGSLNVSNISTLNVLKSTLYVQTLFWRYLWKSNFNAFLISLVGNWTPRAPPGQSNETYFFRPLIMSRKQILMLTGRTNVPWGSFGGHLGFRHTRVAKVNNFHNFWTKWHRHTNNTTFS